jgi:PPOX class probable F420-dependent enzyme
MSETAELDEPTVPESHRDLLEGANVAQLATVRPDGSPQISVMWFDWDGRRARFSHTTGRQKFQNIAHEPRVSFSVSEGINPYRVIEVRGEVESIEPDTDHVFYHGLQKRYGIYPPIRGDRVVLTVRPVKYAVVLTPVHLYRHPPDTAESAVPA